MNTDKLPLLGKSLAELQAIAAAEGLPRFAGKQIAEWLYKKRVTRIDDMTNISIANRERLKTHYTVGRITPHAHAQSADGTRKYLFLTSIGQPVECVYLPMNDTDRTLCISTQAGCKMGCRFCMTGKLGFHGHLTAADMLAQILHFPDLSNIVVMGEGEPMDNIDHLLRMLSVMTSEWGCAWSPKRITVSSVGAPIHNLKRFLDESECHLAISLHNPIAGERAAIMPAQRLVTIDEVVELIRQYDWSHQRRISFEYICWAGVNDDLRHADALLRLTRGIEARVNLIRFHESPATQAHATYTADRTLFPASDEQRMVTFRDYLTAHGLTATIRKSRGEDILAACGMLVNALQE